MPTCSVVSKDEVEYPVSQEFSMVTMTTLCVKSLELRLALVELTTISLENMARGGWGGGGGGGGGES